MYNSHRKIPLCAKRTELKVSSQKFKTIWLLQQNVACSTIRNNAGHILRQFCCNTKVPDLFINEFIPIPTKQSYRNEMKDSTANSGVDNQTTVTLQKEIEKIDLDIN